MQFPNVFQPLNDFSRTDRFIYGEGFSSKYSTWELQSRKTIAMKDEAEESSILSASYCTKEEHPQIGAVQPTQDPTIPDD
jgi:hypothetical protein